MSALNTQFSSKKEIIPNIDKRIINMKDENNLEENGNEFNSEGKKKEKKHSNEIYNLKKKLFVKLFKFLITICSEMLREKNSELVLKIDSLIKKKPSNKNIIITFKKLIKNILILQKSKADILDIGKDNNNFQKIINMDLYAFFHNIYLSNKKEEVKSKYHISSNLLFFEDFLESLECDECKKNYNKLKQHLIELLKKKNIFKVTKDKRKNNINNRINNLEFNHSGNNDSIGADNNIFPQPGISSPSSFSTGFLFKNDE